MKIKRIHVGLTISLILNLVLLVFLKYTSSVDLYFSFIELFKVTFSSLVTLTCFGLGYKFWHSQKQKELFSAECKDLHFMLYNIEKSINELKGVINKNGEENTTELISKTKDALKEIDKVEKNYSWCCDILNDKNLKQCKIDFRDIYESVSSQNNTTARIGLDLNKDDRIKYRMNMCRIPDIEKTIETTKGILITHIQFKN